MLLLFSMACLGGGFLEAPKPLLDFGDQYMVGFVMRMLLTFFNTDGSMWTVYGG